MKGRPEKLEGTNEPKRRQTLSYEWDTARGKARQTKVAYARAAKAGTTGLVLHRAFHKAFSVAKRVRKETLIGHRAISASSTAVGLVGRIFDRLDDKTAMLIGAGRMGELTARGLKRLGIGTLLITNPTFERAVALAHELGGTSIP